MFIDCIALQNLCDSLMDGHISYGLGSKAKLSADAQDIKKIDCSGFVRYLLYNATGGVVMPDGSVVQNDWCKKSKYARVAYSTAAASDGALRIAFLKGNPGHVWFVLNGLTMESHSGTGPDRRPWDTAILKKRVCDCYLLGQTYLMNDQPFVGRKMYA